MKNPISATIVMIGASLLVGAASSSSAATAPTLTQGFLTVQRWEDIGANTGTGGIDDLKAAIAAGPPTTTFFVAGADVPQSNPDLSNFGVMVSGWVKPDVTGDYDFFTRSDDPSQVFLNPTAAASGTNTLPNIATDTPIAQEDACCNAFAEPSAGTSRTTATPIHLEAGKLYGLVVLQKEGGGGDFVQVAWRLTTDTKAAASLQPIPGANCFTLASPDGQTASITKQPQSATVTEGKTGFFNIAVTTSPVAGTFSVQWLTNGAVVPSASGTSFTTPITTLADSGTQIKARVFTLVGALDSDAAVLTVNADTNPPVVIGATAFPGSTKVGLLFDKPLEAATAGNAANYKVNGAAVSSALVRTNVANELTDEKNLVQLTVPTALTTNFTLVVEGVKDSKGHAMAATTVPGKILDLTISDIGSPATEPADDPAGPDPQGPSTVTTWGPGAFDVLTTGSNDYWNNADGFNFIWAPKTNSFDVKVRVVSVSPINNWSAGAIEVREGPPTDNGKGWELARHYFCKVDYGGPDPIPVLDGSGDGADSYEFNARFAPGDPAVRENANSGPGQSYGWNGTGPGNPSPVPFPNAWIRIARVKNGTNDHLLGYSSSDGVEWSLRQDVDLNDTSGPPTDPDGNANGHAGFVTRDGTPAGKWPDVCYVGLASVSHTGIGNNNPLNEGNVGEFWYSPTGQPYSAYIIYRDYGDVTTTTPPVGSPTLAFTLNADATVTLTYTGALYSSGTVNGPYALVSGATSPYKVTPKASPNPATFYQAGP